LRMIQLVLSTAAAAARHTPNVMKNAIVVLRLVMRMMREVRIALEKPPITDGWSWPIDADWEFTTR